MEIQKAHGSYARFLCVDCYKFQHFYLNTNSMKRSTPYTTRQNNKQNRTEQKPPWLSRV